MLLNIKNANTFFKGKLICNILADVVETRVHNKWQVVAFPVDPTRAIITVRLFSTLLFKPILHLGGIDTLTEGGNSTGRLQHLKNTNKRQNS